MPPCDYAVRLVRAKHRSDSYVWPISLRSPLPVVAVPLLAGDADGLLDLQTVFTAGYDNAAYDVGIDYSRDSVPPLNPEDAAWADQLLRAAGLRKRRSPASRKRPGH